MAEEDAATVEGMWQMITGTLTMNTMMFLTFGMVIWFSQHGRNRAIAAVGELKGQGTADQPSDRGDVGESSANPYAAAGSSLALNGFIASDNPYAAPDPVSYTHLTLPTICSV